MGFIALSGAAAPMDPRGGLLTTIFAGILFVVLYRARVRPVRAGDSETVERRGRVEKEYATFFAGGVAALRGRFQHVGRQTQL